MPIHLRSVAREMRELYWEDAERICMRSAEHAERDGDEDMAKGWREIAAEVVRIEFRS